LPIRGPRPGGGPGLNPSSQAEDSRERSLANCEGCSRCDRSNVILARGRESWNCRGGEPVRTRGNACAEATEAVILDVLERKQLEPAGHFGAWEPCWLPPLWRADGGIKRSRERCFGVRASPGQDGGWGRQRIGSGRKRGAENHTWKDERKVRLEQ